jgi:hypothetical protein
MVIRSQTQLIRLRKQSDRPVRKSSRMDGEVCVCENEGMGALAQNHGRGCRPASGGDGGMFIGGGGGDFPVAVPVWERSSHVRVRSYLVLRNAKHASRIQPGHVSSSPAWIDTAERARTATCLSATPPSPQTSTADSRPSGASRPGISLPPLPTDPPLTPLFLQHNATEGSAGAPSCSAPRPLHPPAPPARSEARAVAEAVRTNCPRRSSSDTPPPSPPGRGLETPRRSRPRKFFPPQNHLHPPSQPLQAKAVQPRHRPYSYAPHYRTRIYVRFRQLTRTSQCPYYSPRRP